MGRLFATALLVGTAASLAGAIGADSGCVTVPPSDVPTPAQHRPVILRASVVPPPDEVLTQWPADNTFLVPVELSAPELFYFNVFIDFDPYSNSGPALFGAVAPGTAVSDAGIPIASFVLKPPDGNLCHRIEFIVAMGFNASSSHTPNSLGGDVVSWLYSAGGGPNGCPLYDAGAAQNGAFPDAAEEVIQIVSPPGGDL